MKKNMAISILFMILTLGMTGMAGAASLEAMGHKYIMVGQILEVHGDSAYLCIGSKEGAQVGQELTVTKYVSTSGGRAGATPTYKREEIGTIKILEIVDEHMAKAKIVKGNVKKNYVVELNQ